MLLPEQNQWISSDSIAFSKIAGGSEKGLVVTVYEYLSFDAEARCLLAVYILGESNPL